MLALAAPPGCYWEKRTYFSLWSLRLSVGCELEDHKIEIIRNLPKIRIVGPECEPGPWEIWLSRWRWGQGGKEGEWRYKEGLPTNYTQISRAAAQHQSFLKLPDDSRVYCAQYRVPLCLIQLANNVQTWWVREGTGKLETAWEAGGAGPGPRLLHPHHK